MTTGSEKNLTRSRNSYDVNKVRLDFPIFTKRAKGKPLIYLDNAATTQKPQSVIDAITHFYALECSSIHRGVYSLSETATESYESSRTTVCRFINASSTQEIVFVSGATHAINLVAQTYGKAHVAQGDEILISAMEHHSNIVPWQMLCEETGARLRVAPMNLTGTLVLEEYKKLLSPKTRLVAVTFVSNAIGTINPVHEIIRLAHERNIPVLIDAAQAVPHLKVDVQALDCDFLVFSGHKLYGPTGIGVLYGKEHLLDAMPPYQAGGDMVQSVSFEKTLYAGLPHKFEAGTPNIAGVIGLGAAIDYLESLGIENISSYEQELLTYGLAGLKTLDAVQVIGTAEEKASILSFILEGVHPHDIGTILDREGIAIRTGHHCAQPVMDFFHVSATARASLGLYNSREDIDALIAGLQKVKEIFG